MTYASRKRLNGRNKKLEHGHNNYLCDYRCHYTRLLDYSRKCIGATLPTSTIRRA